MKAFVMIVNYFVIFEKYHVISEKLVGRNSAAIDIQNEILKFSWEVDYKLRSNEIKLNSRFLLNAFSISDF